MVNFFIGIDAGTGSVKIGCFGHEGELRGLVRKEYSLMTRPNGWIEQEAEVYWQKTFQSLRELIDRSDVDPLSIRTISISSQAQTLFCYKGKLC